MMMIIFVHVDFGKDLHTCILVSLDIAVVHPCPLEYKSQLYSIIIIDYQSYIHINSIMFHLLHLC